MVTIRQVAKACGVSPMTVSFVLNNRAGAVSEETRERVLRAVREMNYRPAAVKQQQGSVLTLGLVAGVAGHSLMQHGYYNSVAVGIIEATDQLEHNITVFSNSLLHTDPHQSLRVYCDGRCDGLLVIAPRPGNTLVETLRERGIPFVLIGDTGDTDGVSCVDIDNVSEGKKATNYLIGQGHRRIAFVPGPNFVRSSLQRKEGYCQAMQENGLISDPSVEWGDIVRSHEADAWIRRLMARPFVERPTALFCWNDGAAVAAMEVLKEEKIAVPQDVSVIGIDGDEDGASYQPTLTTLRQPHREIGRRGVEILIDLIRQTTSAPHREFFNTELIVRDSVRTLS